MRTRKHLLIAASFLFSASAFADVCPTNGEAGQTTPYTVSIACSVGTVVIEGRKNPSKNWECFNRVPAAEEHASVLRDGKAIKLPSVNALIAQDQSLSDRDREDFAHRTWMASKVTCEAAGKVTIEYWGGGNCRGCERRVTYQFSPDGRLLNAK